MRIAVSNCDTVLARRGCIVTTDLLQRLRDEATALRDWGTNRECTVVADLHLEAAAEIERLRSAAQAVVDRWDTPLWKDVPATGEFINALRTALARWGGRP